MTNQGTLNETPIDLVYLWVDGNDINWQKKRAQYQQQTENCDPQAIDTCRFYNNDELKYSLRSVEKNIPWINRIFVITDEQTPAWLNTNHPKIRIVDHKEIIPADKLPLFNSTALEMFIPFIPELSEHFLYANDDTFVWNSTDKEFFFPAPGKAYCRFGREIKEKHDYSQYRELLLNAYKEISSKYNIPITPHYPHHNMDAYLKSAFLDCLRIFKHRIDINLSHRFRDSTDFHRSAIDFYALANNLALPRIIKKKNWFQKYILKQHEESRSYNFHGHRIEKIKKRKYNLLCINDCLRTSMDDRHQIRLLLEEKFPEKSSFEL